MRLRITKIDEYQFLTCLKHGLWGSKSARFKTWKVGDKLAIMGYTQRHLRAAPPAAPPQRVRRPQRAAPARWRGLQPGGARRRATVAGAGQASQDGVG